ncbi:nuclease-related domain-containing protein [Neobacillus sp. K501]
MGFIAKIFGKKEKEKKVIINKSKVTPKITPERIGDLGEYKINIQLDQFPSNYKHLKDIMLVNKNSKSGFSQIDHILLTPYGIFVIETKNYAGEIVGSKSNKQWVVNKRYKMMNPFLQNYGHVQTIKRELQLSEDSCIISVISFTRSAIFRVDPELREIKSNELCVYDTELTEFITRKIRFSKLQTPTHVYSEKQIEKMFNTLNAANITDKQIRENHKIAIKTHKNAKSKCATCGIEVSDRIKEFCLSNKKFQGNIYCFEHQKGKQ